MFELGSLLYLVGIFKLNELHETIARYLIQLIMADMFVFSAGPKKAVEDELDDSKTFPRPEAASNTSVAQVQQPSKDSSNTVTTSVSPQYPAIRAEVEPQPSKGKAGKRKEEDQVASQDQVVVDIAVKAFAKMVLEEIGQSSMSPKSDH